MKKSTRRTVLIIFLVLFFFSIIEFELDQLNQASGTILLLQLPSSSSIITISSPKNTTYSDIDVPFDCQYNTELFTVSYSLDGSQRIPFEKDKILTDLSAGNHRLEVYAHSLDGNIEKIIDTDSVDVLTKETAEIITYFQPEKPGRYEISGRILYNNKMSFEKGSIMVVLPSPEYEEEMKKRGRISYKSFIPFVILIIIFIFLIMIKRKRGKKKKKRIVK